VAGEAVGLEATGGSGSAPTIWMFVGTHSQTTEEAAVEGAGFRRATLSRRKGWV
jgi:hypothetical protein